MRLFKEVRTWWGKSLRRRLLVASLATLFLFLGTLGTLAFFIGRAGVRYEVDQRNRQLAELAAKDISAHFNNLWGNMQLFAYQLEAADELLPLQIRAMLELRLAAPLTYRALYLFDAEGELLTHLADPLGDLVQIEDSAALLDRPAIPLSPEIEATCQAAKQGDLFLSPTYVVGADQVPVMYIGVPVLDKQAQVQQIVVAEIDLRDIWRRIDEIRIGQTGRGFVASRAGTIIAHPDRAYIGQPLPPALQPVIEGYVGQVEYVDQSSQRVMLAAYTPVGGQSGWGIVIEQSRAEAFAVVNTIAWVTPVILFIALGLATWVTVWIARTITYPIQHLVNVTQDIATTGDLSQDVVVHNQDEVGQLATTFNHMVDSLRQAKQEIANYNRTLETQVAERTQELQTAYADIAEQHETLDVIVRSIADGLLVIDEDSQITLSNPAIADFLGTTTEALVGQDVWDVLPSPALHKMVTQALKTPDAVSIADVVLPNGVILRSSVGVLLHPQRDDVGVVLSLRDVTHELEVDRMKTEFVSMVSHELRTPLTSVLGFAKLIQKDFEQRISPALPTENNRLRRYGQRIQDNLTIIVTEAERLARLIADVLDIAKMEAGRIEWEMRDMTLTEVLDQAVAATRALAEEKDLPITLDVADPIAPLYADQDRIVQVVTNLLSNAIKYTDTGKVQVRAWTLREGDDIPPVGPRYADANVTLPVAQPMVAVSVQDTGVGIAEADLNGVFEKFKQVGDRTSGTRRPGTGLGLPICREIVEHHGGYIWVESQLGKGSRFVFTLPYGKSARMEVPALKAQSPAG